MEVSTPELGVDHMVMDFAELDFVRDWINIRWDHRHLNDYLTFPTAEVIAETFGRFVAGELMMKLPRTQSIAVTVHESTHTFARWSTPRTAL